MTGAENARKRLASKAKGLREEKGLSQSDLAKEIGIYQSDVSVFERKGDGIGIEKIEKIFNFFGFQLDISEKKTQFPLRLNGAILSN